MERVKPSRSCADPEKFFVQGAQKVKIFNLPLTHSDMLNLHFMFMKPEQHVLHTRDIEMGRSIILQILNSLNYYQNIGSLTRSSIKNKGTLDIFAMIQKHAQVYGLKQAINQFFIENIQLDFVWIELTKELVVQMGQSNIDYFVSIMTQHQSMPVIIFHYDN